VFALLARSNGAARLAGMCVDISDFLLILPWNLRDEVTNEMPCIREWGADSSFPSLSSLYSSERRLALPIAMER
jgi:hypothetical protein